jgi:hypothetical protein
MTNQKKVTFLGIATDRHYKTNPVNNGRWSRLCSFLEKRKKEYGFHWTCEFFFPREHMKIQKSSRPSKKLMAIFDDGSRVHFGAAGYGDYTVYWKRDPALAKRKRAQYIARHGATESWTNPRTPATLSRYILWEKPTVPEAVRAYKTRFTNVGV